MFLKPLSMKIEHKYKANFFYMLQSTKCKDNFFYMFSNKNQLLMIKRDPHLILGIHFLFFISVQAFSL